MATIVNGTPSAPAADLAATTGPMPAVTKSSAKPPAAQASKNGEPGRKASASAADGAQRYVCIPSDLLLTPIPIPFPCSLHSSTVRRRGLQMAIESPAMVSARAPGDWSPGNHRASPTRLTSNTQMSLASLENSFPRPFTHSFPRPKTDGNRASRRSVPPKAWQSGMNPITHRSNNVGQQNGAGQQAKSGQRATGHQDANASEKLVHERLLYLLGNFMV